ncbi:MAB_1171c family putative transporter [Amycolatopsis sp. A133]|uniref:MAB_1171c family putative transporter n=1 Tax=Amycolatopsis sp. A133 TaxID=3064472 RepID=UPI0027FAE8AA|nr:MAB_1171c family putative transporter [Amycolatopsis sp. A133]MDQ7808719.1 MAB_1171c family putative transporter [Amycolatopsis sp. A133]
MIFLDSTVLAATGATAAWLLFLRAVLRNPRNDALLCAWLCALLVAFGLYLGLLEYGAEATRPLPLWARISATTQHVCTVVGLYSGYCAYAFLVHEHREAVRHTVRQAWVLAATLTLMVLPAVLADPGDFTAAHLGHYGESSLAGGYLVVFTIYAGIIVGALAKTSWTWSRRADDRWIRRGLLAGTAGLLAGVLYFLLRAGYLALAVTGHQPAAKEGSLIGWLLAVAVPLSLCGLTAPVWGPRLSQVRGWWWAYHAHRRLRPLWAELTGAFPHVRLSLPPSRPGWSPLHRHVDLRLHLRVMQIWDARRALLGYCRDADYRRALSESTLPEPRRAAHAEAAMLAAGLRRFRTGQSPGEPGGNHAEPRVRDADLTADVAWLVQVSRSLPVTGPAD